MSNNWNDPNAPQGENNQGGWQQPAGDAWNQNQQPAEQQPWDQGQQPPANQGWDQNQAQPSGQSWDQGQPAAGQGWDQSQPSANQAWEQQAPGQGWNQQAPGQPYGTPSYGTDPGYAAGAGYGAAPGYGAPGYGTPGYGAPVVPAGAKIGPLGMPLANWGKRALGGLLDFVLPGIVIGIITSLIFPPETSTTGGGFTATQTNNLPSIISTLLLYAILAYVSQKNGQSWGRKVAKTQLVGEDGRPIGLGKSFLRYVLHYIDSIICLIGWLFPLWDGKRQTIADKIMKTYVIDVEQSGPINVQP